MALLMVLAAWVVLSVPVSLLAACRLHRASVDSHVVPAWAMGSTAERRNSRAHDIAS